MITITILLIAKNYKRILRHLTTLFKRGRIDDV